MMKIQNLARATRLASVRENLIKEQASIAARSAQVEREIAANAVELAVLGVDLRPAKPEMKPLVFDGGKMTFAAGGVINTSDGVALGY